MSNVPATTAKPPAPTAQSSLIVRFAERYGVEPGKMMTTLKQTCFRLTKKDKSVIVISDEQMMALLIVADQYKLNPFTREIFAFPQDEGIVPIVSVDGWCRIINEHPMMDGIEFEYGPEIPALIEDGKVIGVPVNEYITCVISRKDRTKPIKVSEYIVECRKNSTPWASHPRRMLRHKALIQGARIAFGFAGIYDEDEGMQIVENMATETKQSLPPIQTGRIKQTPTKAITSEAKETLDAIQQVAKEPVKQVQQEKKEVAKEYDIPVEAMEPVADKPVVIPGEDAELPEWVVTVMNEIDNSPKVSTTESIGNRIYTEFRSPETPEPDKVSWYPVLFMAWAERIGFQSSEVDRPRIIKKLETWRPNLGSLASKVFDSFTKGTES